MNRQTRFALALIALLGSRLAAAQGGDSPEAPRAPSRIGFDAKMVIWWRQTGPGVGESAPLPRELAPIPPAFGRFIRDAHAQATEWRPRSRLAEAAIRVGPDLFDSPSAYAAFVDECLSAGEIDLPDVCLYECLRGDRRRLESLPVIPLDGSDGWKWAQLYVFTQRPIPRVARDAVPILHAAIVFARTVRGEEQATDLMALGTGAPPTIGGAPNVRMELLEAAAHERGPIQPEVVDALLDTALRRDGLFDWILAVHSLRRILARDADGETAHRVIARVDSELNRVSTWEIEWIVASLLITACGDDLVMPGSAAIAHRIAGQARAIQDPATVATPETRAAAMVSLGILGRNSSDMAELYSEAMTRASSDDADEIPMLWTGRLLAAAFVQDLRAILELRNPREPGYPSHQWVEVAACVPGALNQDALLAEFERGTKFSPGSPVFDWIERSRSQGAIASKLWEVARRDPRRMSGDLARVGETSDVHRLTDMMKSVPESKRADLEFGVLLDIATAIVMRRSVDTRAAQRLLGPFRGSPIADEFLELIP